MSMSRHQCPRKSNNMNVVNKYFKYSAKLKQPLADQSLFIIEASLSQPVRHTTLGRTPPLDE